MLKLDWYHSYSVFLSSRGGPAGQVGWSKDAIDQVLNLHMFQQ